MSRKATVFSGVTISVKNVVDTITHRTGQPEEDSRDMSGRIKQPGQTARSGQPGRDSHEKTSRKRIDRTEPLGRHSLDRTTRKIMVRTVRASNSNFLGNFVYWQPIFIKCHFFLSTSLKRFIKNYIFFSLCIGKYSP